nr:hypothetical protein CFP56_61229 [Quercus suber]
MAFVFAGNKEPELFSLVAWNLWNRRNNLRLGKPALPLEKITEHARERQLEALAPSTFPSRHRGQHQTACTPPEIQHFKINYDAATFVEDNKAVIEAEALAARRAMELALELSLDNIVLEGDNESLFKALKSRDKSLTQYGHLLKDILFLSSHFSDFTVSFARRQYNKMTHSLVRKAKSLPFMTVWMDVVPPDHVSILQADLNSLP